MAQPSGPSEIISGTVEATNERGVKVAGEWWNVSKYKPVALPMRGAHVVLTVQDRWIQAVDVQDGPSASESRGAPSGCRERTITRLAVLKAASTFAASRPDAKSCDVLKVADAWLRWVEGGEAAADE